MASNNRSQEIKSIPQSTKYFMLAVVQEVFFMIRVSLKDDYRIVFMAQEFHCLMDFQDKHVVQC